MKTVFVSNYFNHHQKPLCDALFRRTGGQFLFIGTGAMSDERRQMGYAEASVPEYVRQLQAAPAACRQAIDRADLVLFGSGPYSLLKQRLAGKKLTLKYSERIYKTECPAWQLPLRAVKYWAQFGRHSSCYLLCAGAYTARDYAKTGTFLGKAYRWGYFPEARPSFPAKANGPLRLLWAGRMLPLKHPEVATHLAKQLKDRGFQFTLDMIGTGPLEDALKAQVRQEGLADCVRFLGAKNPEQVRSHMEQADIFLMTSDRREGWGAVVNEAMNSGCAVIASRAVGSAPYLICQGKNGFLYTEEAQAYSCLERLMQEDGLRRHMGQAAFETIRDVWNAEAAAQRLLILAQQLQQTGSCDLFESGPCSRA